MPKLKPGTIIPSMEEDIAINEAAMQDADAIPFTDDEWATVELKLKRSRSVKDTTTMQTSTRIDL